MASGPEIQIPKLRCAPFHLSLDVDPIGSAANYDAYLCVDVPLPWEHDISMNHPFNELAKSPFGSLKGSDGRKWRPQGLTPTVSNSDSDGQVRVTAWQQASGSSVLESEPESSSQSRTGTSSVGPLQRTDWLVNADRCVDLLRGILECETGDFNNFVVIDESQSALYVCTHGQRDVCCGGLGTDLYKKLAANSDLTEIELHRCSHTGGHRFAVTGLTFPDGYAWAHLNVEVAAAVATRSVHPRDLAFHCRGSSLFASGPAQVADRFGLCSVGWAWADNPRSVELLGFERRSMATDLRITGHDAEGAPHPFELRVGVEEYVPQITCGVINEPEYKVEPVWRIEASREVEPVAD